MRTMQTGIRILIFLLALAFAAPQAVAQQASRATRAPAGNPPVGQDESSSSADKNNAGVEPATASAPDQRPVTGVEQYSVGGLDNRRSYFTGSVQYTQLGDTNFNQSVVSDGRFESFSILQTRLSLERFWGRYHLTTSYGGGGTVSVTGSDRNHHHHNLAVSQRIDLRRWEVLIGNQFTYLPESAFGFSNFNTLGIGNLLGHGLGVGGFLINPAFSPADTILSGQSRRISNTTVGQVHYQATPRTTLTASGSHGLIHFFESGLVDGRTMVGSFGYNYLLGPLDTLSVLYSYSRFGFSGTGANVQSHTAQLGYARRITGRMFFHVSGGPDLQQFDSGVTGFGSRRVTWGARTGLGYNFQRSTLSLYYLAFTSGGSGVLPGARSHLVDVNYSRRLSQVWSTQLNAGYARNSALSQISPVLNQSFDAIRGSVNIGRPIGRQLHMSFNYGIQNQRSNLPFCIGEVCGRSSIRHTFGVIFNFNFRPVGID